VLLYISERRSIMKASAQEKLERIKLQVMLEILREKAAERKAQRREKETGG
jgi:hypothetical protein